MCKTACLNASKDTPDFLRTVNEVNEIEDLEGNLILVTMDVAALYTNIPNDEGMEAVREAFEEKNIQPFKENLFLDFWKLFFIIAILNSMENCSNKQLEQPWEVSQFQTMQIFSWLRK